MIILGEKTIRNGIRTITESARIDKTKNRDYFFVSVKRDFIWFLCDFNLIIILRQFFFISLIFIYSTHFDIFFLKKNKNRHGESEQTHTQPSFNENKSNTSKHFIQKISIDEIRSFFSLSRTKVKLAHLLTVCNKNQDSVKICAKCVFRPGRKQCD